MSVALLELSGGLVLQRYVLFHEAPVYGGDLHRADLAWEKHAAGCGMTLEQIKDELLDGRDLSKKGGRHQLSTAGLPLNVAQLYMRKAEGIYEGKSVSPDFDVAVKRHELLDAIQKASDTD